MFPVLEGGNSSSNGNSHGESYLSLMFGREKVLQASAFNSSEEKRGENMERDRD